MKRLNRELNSLLLKLAKRNNPNHVIWFNSSLAPLIGDCWNCYICQQDFAFRERVSEIDEHGFAHLKDSNLLPFV